MRKNKLFVFLSLIVMIAMLAACAPASPAEPAAPAEESAPAAEEVAEEAPVEEASMEEALPAIVVAIWSSPEHDNLVKAAADYTQLTGNEVIIEEIAREAYFDKIKTVLVSGSSDYDAFYSLLDEVPAYVEAEGLADFNQFMDDPSVVADYFDLAALEPGVDFFTIGGKVYGFPSEGDTAWMWYRKDLLEEAGIAVPQTWDEYLAAAQALNNPPELYGAVDGSKRMKQSGISCIITLLLVVELLMKITT